VHAFYLGQEGGVVTYEEDIFVGYRHRDREKQG